MRGVVTAHETCLTLELGKDRPDLHFDLTAVGLTFDLGELRSGQARGDAFEVGEHAPCLVDRDVDREFVMEIH